jgi:hypothetical protein
MARIARFVAVGCPHHVTQRGNRRQKVFFGDEDTLRLHERTGTPLGSASFIERLEGNLGRTLTSQKLGRKKKPEEK